MFSLVSLASMVGFELNLLSFALLNILQSTLASHAIATASLEKTERKKVDRKSQLSSAMPISSHVIALLGSSDTLVLLASMDQVFIDHLTMELLQ